MADQTLEENQTQTPVSTIEILQPDILKDILSRLPINSVSESKLVSPLWRNLINEPRFPMMHYNHSIYLNHNQQQLIYGRIHLRCIPDIDTCDKVINLTHDKFPFKTSFPISFCIVGSCNGLICLSDDPKKAPERPLVICNPVNGDWVKPPDPPVITDDRFHVHVFIGFGYSTKSSEYKILRMGIDQISGNSTVHIITLGENSWRSLGNVGNVASKVVKTYSKGHEGVEHFGVYLNGNLHWLMPYNGSMEPGIRGFNVEEEHFVMVPFPDSLDDKKIRGLLYMGLLYLGVLGGCLMMVDYSNGDVTQVWIMKEYGVKESWVLEYVIRVPKDMGGSVLRPVAVQKNGKVVLQRGRTSAGWYCYDRENETILKLQVPGPPMALGAVPHGGTFVSLKDVIARSQKSESVRLCFT